MVNTGVRLLGAILVVVSCSGMGFFLAGQWGERLKTMEHLRKMIFLLKGEIVYARSALPESFERTGKKGGGEIGDLFVRVAGRDSGGNHFTISGRRRSRSFQKPSASPKRTGRA